MSYSTSSSRPSIKLDEATEQLQTKLLRLTGETIGEYGLIKDGDKIMVCLSGGKDSYVLLDLLLVLQWRAQIHFDLVAVNLDQKQPGFPAHVLPGYFSHIGMPFHIEEWDTYSIVKRLIPEGQTTCSPVPDSVLASYIASPRNWARPRSHWGTTAMTLLKPCF